MKAWEALQGVYRLFLDTAPVIYYIEKHPVYFPVLSPIFDQIDRGTLMAVTSPITLSECLVLPYRLRSIQLQRDFTELIVRGKHTMFVWLDEDCGQRAAEIRARYNLTLLDAFQIAAALSAGCEALLTNDRALTRVTDLRILMLEDIEA